MKDLKTILTEGIHEGILSDIDNTVDSMDNNLESVLNVPTVKDFEQNKYNKNVYMVVWQSPILEKYQKKYPEMFGKFDSLAISIRKDSYGIDIYPQLVMHSRNGTKSRITKNIFGWRSSYVTQLGLRNAKKVAIDIIDKLAHNENKLDAFFKHAAFCYDMVDFFDGDSTNDYDVKDFDKLRF